MSSMNNEKFSNYYLGLDIGTNSVGWCVTDPQYNVLKFNGKAMWGIRLFDEAVPAKERRVFRSNRRRLDRRKQRLNLLEELLSEEICKVDPLFYLRMKESKFYLEDKKQEVRQKYTLFCDERYTDVEYHKEFPTIYHLRSALIKGERKYDIRLYFLAIHNIMKHRGHFLFEGDVSQAVSFDKIYENLKKFLCDEYEITIDNDNKEKLQEIIKNKQYGRKAKKDEIIKLFNPQDSRLKEMLAAISGATVTLQNLYDDESLKDVEVSKICFAEGIDDSKMDILNSILGDRIELVERLQAVYDWGLLANILNGKESISEAQVAIYNKHKKDLKDLKYAVKKYCGNKYKEVFCGIKNNKIDKKQSDSEKNENSDSKKKNKSNYPAYVEYLSIKGDKIAIENSCTQEDFCKYIKSLFDKINVDDEIVNRIKAETENNTFMPKQISKNNSVIPYQLHLADLHAILKNMQRDYPEYAVKGNENLTICDKIEAIFTFRIPYYVGPLNDYHKGKGGNCWIVRKEQGKVYPWNFDEKVDTDACAEQFIKKMTNKCTYLVGEDVLPKNSLLYSKFMVLNELNNIKINGDRIKVDLKQEIYTRVFVNSEIKGKITKNKLHDWLVKEGKIEKTDEITGMGNSTDIDRSNGREDDFKASIASYKDLKAIIGNVVDIKPAIAEDIINCIVIFGDDRKLLKNRLKKLYGMEINDEQIKKIIKLRYTGWGKLSEKMLDGILAVNTETGEPISIIRALWETSNNFMELLSDRYGYMDAINEFNAKANGHPTKLTYELVDQTYASPAVKRAIWQTLLIVKEIQKIAGNNPKRVFVEMARQEDKKKKGKNISSRRDMLISLYKSCKDEERDWVEEIKKYSEAELRRKKLFLYYTQMGRCMYSGESISLDDLYNDNKYDIDHILPQSKTKDDSILNNMVLVCRQKNLEKTDKYPLPKSFGDTKIKGLSTVREFWKTLLDKKLIEKEKYNRLIRSDELSDDELAGFISRQIVETRQTTKVVAEVLNEVLSDTKIVYSKANAVHEFRDDNDFIKVRSVNDLHHAKDAYLNIVVGNVYYTKFTDNPMRYIKEYHKNEKKEQYSLNRMFTFDVERNGIVAWKRGNDGSIKTVKEIMGKNNILFTRYATEKKGGFFNRKILKKGNGQIMIKASERNMPIEKYGGYKSPSINYFILVESIKNNKVIRTLEGLPVYVSDKQDENITSYINSLDLKDPKIILKKIKLNTLLHVDGYPVHISSKSDDTVIVKNAVQLCICNESLKYIKNIEKECEYMTENKNEKLSSSTKVSVEMNKKIYDQLLEKHSNTIYKKRMASQVKTLKKGRDIFVKLSVEKQCRVIMEILHIFDCNAGSSNLKDINGGRKKGICSINKEITKYNSVVLIEQSITGLFEKKIDLLTV